MRPPSPLPQTSGRYVWFISHGCHIFKIESKQLGRGWASCLLERYLHKHTRANNFFNGLAKWPLQLRLEFFFLFSSIFFSEDFQNFRNDSKFLFLNIVAFPVLWFFLFHRVEGVKLLLGNPWIRREYRSHKLTFLIGSYGSTLGQNMPY